MMDIKIYQINTDRGGVKEVFTPLDQLEAMQGNREINASLYDKVFEGSVEADDLEDVYTMFNVDHPDGYAGRSLSVSDILEVKGDTGASEFFYCDSIGFQEVAFDSEKTTEALVKKIKVVYCEPGKKARIAEIGTELPDLQKAVGGWIETYYPFAGKGITENCVIVLNDEGKLNGMRPNRALRDEDGKVEDVIFGPFFICDCSTDSFGSLPKEKQDYFLEKFGKPEKFLRMGSEIVAVPFEPGKEKSGDAR